MSDREMALEMFAEKFLDVVRGHLICDNTYEGNHLALLEGMALEALLGEEEN